MLTKTTVIAFCNNRNRVENYNHAWAVDNFGVSVYSETDLKGI